MQIIVRNGHSKQIIKQKIDEIEEGDKYCVEIKAYVKSRTKAQNRLYWKWMTIIGNELGYKKNEMHTVYANMYLEPVVVEYKGKRYETTRSTTSLNVREFIEYLNIIEQHAATEHGIRVPHPQDSYYEAMGIAA